MRCGSRCGVCGLEAAACVHLSVLSLQELESHESHESPHSVSSLPSPPLPSPLARAPSPVRSDLGCLLSLLFGSFGVQRSDLICYGI